jgi:hypothetical protein
MKKITEMTHDEIIALNDSDLTRLVDIACAEAGVPLQDQAPEAPVKPEYTEAFNSYKIVDIVFKTRESAEALQDCLRKNLRNIWHLHYFDPLERHLAIEDCIFVTDDEQRNRDEESKIYSTELAYYQALKEKYDAHTAARETLAKPILAIYHDDRAKEAVRQMLQRESKRYLSLADQNIDIAINFLCLAFADALLKVAGIFDPEAYMRSLNDELESLHSDCIKEDECPPSKS